MIKINKIWTYLVVFLFCFSLTGKSQLFAASPAKQLAKGIALYEKNKDQEAMDYFIDVLVEGTPDQVAEANKYVTLIHNRVGGIQTPVEVDINFKEGEVKSLDQVADETVLQAQQQAQAAAEEAQAQVLAAQERARQEAQAQVQQATQAVEAEKQALTEKIETERQAAQERATAARAKVDEKAAQLEAAAEAQKGKLEQVSDNVAAATTATAASLGLGTTAPLSEKSAPSDSLGGATAVLPETSYAEENYQEESFDDPALAGIAPSQDPADTSSPVYAEAPVAATAPAAAVAPTSAEVASEEPVLASGQGSQEKFQEESFDDPALRGVAPTEDPAATATPLPAASVLQEEQGAVMTAQAEETALSQLQAEQTPSPEEVLTSVSEPASATFADLTAPEAIQARELYTQQKIESMTAAAVEKIMEAKGVHLYFRDNLPDAVDIDAGVIFDGNKFRTEALPLLNSLYELLALTQGATYTILPPGSYTDDVTLSGIRQAMALNSYFVNRGISQGKLHYNMGLTDQEPPARFANLNGLSIVFDFAGKFPTRLEKNENNEKAPLLSMAVVPLCHAIDRSLGEAFAIDFSVLETIHPVDNWMLQVVQHGRDGNYYVVRQLEGFTPVYHQILWNGRKGIIGPELPCGKYTLVLTAMDLKGQKQTLRRRVIVKCSEQKKAKKTTAKTACTTGTCAATKTTESICPSCDYKTTRLWVKPGRVMKNAQVREEIVIEENQTSSSENTATDTYTKTVTNTTIVETVATDEAETPGVADEYLAPLPQEPASSQPADLPVNNPYDMPYEEYGN